MIRSEALAWNIITSTSKTMIRMVGNVSVNSRRHCSSIFVCHGLDTPKLGVWILDGDVTCSAPLLKFAIKPESLENTVLVLVASMTQPWSLLSTLKRWTTLVEEHIDRLKVDPTRLREMRDHLQYEFQHYTEPTESSMMLSSSSSLTTIKTTLAARVPNSVSSNSLVSGTASSPNVGDEQVILPLPDGVLTKSNGLPMIVVITKVAFLSMNTCLTRPRRSP